jgi:phage head maturation protease
MIKETRLADVKFEETEGKMTLEGYAIVFNQETLIEMKTMALWKKSNVMHLKIP